MNDITATPDSDNLIDIIEEWLNTKSWEASSIYLKEHATQLLNDETLALFEERLSELAAESPDELHDHASEDEEHDHEHNAQEEHEHIIQVLQQHLIIIELARTQSIEAAYEELLKPSQFALALEKLPAEVRTAIEGLMNANDPEELIAQIAQNPILLSDEIFTTVETLLEELQQAGEERDFEGLLERYEVLLQLAEDSEADDDDFEDD